MTEPGRLDQSQSRQPGRLDPSRSRQHSLRYIKHLVKRIVSSDDSHIINLQHFHVALMGDSESTCIAFQQLIFDEYQAKMSADNIERCVQRFRGLFSSISPHQEEDFQLVNLKLQPRFDEGLYCTKEYTSSILAQITTDFYCYLSRNSATRKSMLTSLKLLKHKYTEERKWMTDLEKRCNKIFGGKETLTKNEFHQVIQYQKDLSDRIFHKFDQSQSGTLSVRELYQGLVNILTSSTEGRLRYLFDIYDSDGNGTLNREEVDNVLYMCVSESNLKLHEELVAELSKIVWNNIAGCDGDHITFDEFYKALLKYPAVYSYLTVSVIGREETGQVFRFLERKNSILCSSAISLVKDGCVMLGARCSSNIGLWTLLALYLILTIFLTVQRVSHFLPMAEFGQWHVVAKVAGQLLNFNISLTILFTLRHLPVKLRKIRFVRRLFPLDDTLFLHKMAAYATFLFTIMHITAHGCSIGVKLYNIQDLHPHFFMIDRYKMVFWSGIALSALFLPFILSSTSCLRHKQFEVSQRLHQFCALAWLVCMFPHASNFWKWALGPIILYTGEKLYFTIKLYRNRTTVQTGMVHDDITQLTIRRPENFRYSPGDYVNVNIPKLSRSEWHAFTISSSPLHHQSDTFTLHIRKVGSWTGLLHRTVSQYQQNNNNNSKLSRTSIATVSRADLEEAPPGYSLTDQNSNNLIPSRIFTQLTVVNECSETNQVKEDMSCGLVATQDLDNSSRISPDEESIASGGESIAPAGESIAPSGESIAPDGESIAPDGESIAPDEESIAPAEESIAPDGESIAPSGGTDCTKSNDDKNDFNGDADKSTSSVTRAKSVADGEIQTEMKAFHSMPLRRSVSVDITKVAAIPPVHKRILSSNSLTTLDMVKGKSLAHLGRSSSRSSIKTLDVETAPELDWKVYLDGPYSTPSREILNTKHAILVAGGIGITPFSAVLESTIRLLKERPTGQCCCSKFQQKCCKRQPRLKRIDFFWVTRDQSHLSWFHQVFREIELAQGGLGQDPPLIHLHIYLTGLKQSTDIRGAFLQLALEMIYQEDSLDVLSGLKAKTKAGRPNWDEVLDQVIGSDLGQGQKKSRPKLFVCGPLGLCRELKKVCYNKSIPYKEEVF